MTDLETSLIDLASKGYWVAMGNVLGSPPESRWTCTVRDEGGYVVGNGETPTAAVQHALKLNAE